MEVSLVTMATCLAFFTLVQARGGGDLWNTWPQIHLPKMHIDSEEIPMEQIAIKDKMLSETQSHHHEAKTGTESQPEYRIERFEAIEKSLSYEQVSPSDLGNVKRTRVAIDDAKDILNLNPSNKREEVVAHDIASRKKRHIFGADTRFQITKKFSTVFPFSATARLSTGCSGILIGPRHVLTAAECIHTGKRYRGKAKNIQVGLIHIDNSSVSSQNEILRDSLEHQLEWFDVEQLYVPSGWTTPSYGETRASFNYAVLELARDHNHHCMEVGVSSSINTYRMQRIHISSFDDFEYRPEPVIAYRHCYLVADTTKYLYEKCDSTKSSVGAGIYQRLWDSENYQWERRVMAVKTSENERIRIRGKMTRTGRNVRITVLNFAQICYWVMRDFEACSRGRIEDACVMA